MSANCKLEIPTAAIIPNMTMKTPPTMGSGILTNNAPILPRSPKAIRTRAPNWITRRLPTLQSMKNLQLRSDFYLGDRLNFLLYDVCH